MRKKLISLLTLASFIVFSTSCAIYKTETKRIKTDADWEGKDIKILKLVKKSGETIEFPKKQPGKIFMKGILGAEKETIEIKKENIKKISWDVGKKCAQLLTRDGREYQVISANEQNDRIICVVYKSIPFSEVELITFTHYDSASSTTVSLLAIAGIVLIAVLVVYAKLTSLREWSPIK